MIINCKEKFGYVYFWTCDPIFQRILYAYCEGHGFLWNAFLGWRKTISKTNQQFFWIPKKSLDLLIRLAMELKEN